MQPMPSDTREALRRRGSHHPNFGLWLERCSDTQGPEGHWKTALDADKRAGRPVDGRGRLQLDDPKLISRYAARWQKMLEQVGVTEELQFTAAPEWRVVVGLGEESVLETSIRLHHSCGFPIIPGSALKGLTRSYAELVVCGEKQGVDQTKIRKIFGNQDQAGIVVFYDAVPEYPPKIELDIMNPHYGPYYREANKADPRTPPADWHDPKPVYFLTIGSGSPFRFAVGPRRQNNEADIAAAKRVKVWLLEALEVMGVGAKTTVGYGYWKEIGKPVLAPTEPGLSVAAEQPAPPTGYGRGRVKWFDDQKGYGFIEVDDGGEDVFVHYTGIEGKGFRSLSENDRVEFSIEEDEKGRKAINVRVVED